LAAAVDSTSLLRLDSLSPINSVSDAESQLSTSKQSRFAKAVVETVEQTTIMVRCIPLKYTQEELIEEVQKVNANFNFLYLPKGNKANKNVGYAFINFTSAIEAAQFMEMFEGHCFEHQSKANIQKQAQVSYADLQGYDANVKFFKRSRACKEKFLPFICN
jgi:hypothetical protein